MIQSDRGGAGINRDLDLLTLASNTHLPSTGLDFQRCPCALSKLFNSPPLPHSSSSQLIPDSAFLPPSVCLSVRLSPAGFNLPLLPLVLSITCSLPPSVVNCWRQARRNTCVPQTSRWRRGGSGEDSAAISRHRDLPHTRAHTHWRYNLQRDIRCKHL